MIHSPLSVLIVEDHALVAMELEAIIEETGHVSAGWAIDAKEAEGLMDTLPDLPDLAFVDVNLGDGPSGIEVASKLLQRDVAVVFVTANAKRLDEDMHGAIGIMAKPYSASMVSAALKYLHDGVRNPPPARAQPPGFKLSPRYERHWKAA